MSDILARLNKAANDALNSKSKDESKKHLAKAFLIFTQETSHLQSSYDKLHQRFNKINYQLQKVESSLNNKISELEAVNTYLSSILKNISQGLIFVDESATITTYNKEAQNILKIDETKVLYKNFLDVFKDDFFGFSLKNALTFSQVKNLSYITLRNENERKEIEVSTSFVINSAYRGIIILLKDVTKTQKLQSLASRNERLKEIGKISAMIAHEIKNPLGSIRGFASLLFHDLEDKKPLKEMVSYILDSTKALERIVNNVLEYTRPIALRLTSLDITALIKSIIKSIKMDPKFSDGVKINLYLSENAFYIPADKELLKSALLNLIINAYEAMQDKGLLSIALIKNNDNCIISITDTGDGIEKNDLENIFSLFFTTKRQGNGLGLCLTHKIIKAHLGTIEVRSISYKGTIFTITLPIKRNL